MQIRNDIRRSLAANLNDSQLIMAGERIGADFDEEIDKARRHEARARSGGSDGGGTSAWRRDLLIFTLLLGAFFGFKLGDRALWSPVEGHYAEIAREMVVSKDYLTPRIAGLKYLEKPPLFYWLESANIKLFGLNEWSLRVWPALFAVVGCLAVYFAGSRLFDRRVGLISSVVLATSSLWYVMGHVIDLDMTVSVLITCSLLCFLLGTLEWPGSKRRFWMWGLFVFSALATLAKGLIGIVIPGMVIGS
jgi:4-amino-4-deoxy-L-arabinose transferase-like glycosyltransferase